MCVIIIKQKQNKIDENILRSSARINPDGLGIVWLDTYEVSYHESKEWKQLETTRPFIAHFRYATVGAVNKSNTHPFVCGQQKDELLMMNGTIKGLGNAIDCDSKVLARQLGDKPRQSWKQILTKYTSRFVSINTKTKTFQIYNRELYTHKDGVWYSKDNVLQDIVVGVYGTLKKGHGNNHLLYRSTYVGKGVTQDAYPLLISGLPYLIDEKGVGHNVDVELYAVSKTTLDTLDALEGHPTWYRRKQVPVKMSDGSVKTAWIYFNIREVRGNREMHKTFEQSFKYNNFNYKVKTTYKKKSTQLPFTFESDERQPKFEQKNSGIYTCIDCCNTLEYDYYHNYYCKSCGAWYNEDEVKHFQVS